MSVMSLEKQLDLLEQALSEVSLALIDGDSVRVQSSSAALQQLSVDFLQIVDELGRGSLAPAHVALRIKALAVELPKLNTHLLRRSFYVDRALQIVVPTTQLTTYGASPSPYGAGVRQSGQFKAMSA